MTILTEATVFLVAAVLAVPLFKWLGLGSILGYLAAGVVLGPHATGVVSEPDNVLHFAELGVVLLLFLIGLELQPDRLWKLRKPVFGLGSAQLFGSGLLLSVIGLMLGMEMIPSLLLGLILGLSSTAFALQILTEKHQLATPHGQATFAILLFQDMAVIPLLALLPLFGAGEAAPTASTWLAVGQALLMIVAVVLVGRLLVPRFLSLVARSKVHELFTAAALLVVIGTALLMAGVGLSMALGAFLAGVLLADTPYRHELEANIEPFKGLLLGLFFIAVGMSVDLQLVREQWLTILALVGALVSIKFALMYGIGRALGMPNRTALPLAAVLPQGGEFDFVLLSAAMTAGVIAPDIANLCIAAVTISMALTPLLFGWVERRVEQRPRQPEQYDTVEDNDPQVIIGGFGRFGQITARVLRTQGIRFTVLEPSFQQVEFVRRFGNKIYFGDTTKLEVLRAARADNAKVFVLAIDKVEESIKTVKLLKQHFPHLEIYARARNRHHAYKLLELGVDKVVRETFPASLEMSNAVLKGLGYPASTAKDVVRTFREFDEKHLQENFQFQHDEESAIVDAHEAARELERLFKRMEKG